MNGKISARLRHVYPADSGEITAGRLVTGETSLTDNLLNLAAERSINYLNNLAQRSVVPSPEALARLQELDTPLADEPTPPEKVLARLDDIGSPATVASAGGRYYGFVT